MKKRVLLALLPAAMILAACAGAGQKANDKNVLFNEDTLAHEELFAQKGFGKIHKLSHLDSSLPAIGVQRSDVKEITVSGTPTNVVSIRFVAAVNLDSEHLADAHPIWTRVLYEEDGDGVLKGVDTLESTKAYTKINDGGSGTLPSAFGEYNYFVTYTMTNIPVAYNNCYFNVSLSLGGVSSRVLATTVDLSSHFSFESTSENFFLTGTFNDVARDIAQDTSTKGDNPSSNFASFSYDILENDKFIIVQKTSTVFKTWDSSCLTGTDNDVGTYFEADASQNIKCKLGSGEHYVLFLNKSNELWVDIEGLYLRGIAGNGWDNPTLAYRFTYPESGNYAELLDVTLKVGLFRFANYKNYKTEFGFWGHRINNGDYTYPSGGGVQGTADGKIVDAGGGEGIHDMYCNTAGRYNIYINGSKIVYFTYIGA